MTTPQHPKPTKIWLSQKELEPFLKFPSGLPIPQAKRRAKAIAKAQGIALSEALKIVAWGNGLEDVRDYSQALGALCECTFGVTNKQMWLTENVDGELTGYCFYSLSAESYMQATTEHGQKELLIESMATFLKDEKESVAAKRRFLDAVKAIIKQTDQDFLTLNGVASLDEVIELNQLNIDIDRLLTAKCGYKATLCYALACCYNDTDTAGVTFKKNLSAALESTGLINVDKRELDDIDMLTTKASRYFTMGPAFYGLDKKNKKLLCSLIENYQGW